MAKSKLAGLIIDCQTDPQTASSQLPQWAEFWSQALGYPIKPSADSLDASYILLDTGAYNLHIELQAVDHPSRVHIDLAAEDVEAEVARLEALGASRVNQVHGWWVMEAPSGHRFCVLPKIPLAEANGEVSLRPIDAENWRAVAELRVLPEQERFVGAPTYYLCLCQYSPNGWQPLAIYANDEVIGMMMWAVDPADGACWFGGILIDQQWQRQGYGRRAIDAAMTYLKRRYGYAHFALSYQPTNPAKALYHSLGFVEQDEWEGEEIVARKR